MPSPVQFAMRASHTKLYYTPSKIPSPLGVSMRGKSPRRSLQALQWKEEQCEACVRNIVTEQADLAFSLKPELRRN